MNNNWFSLLIHRSVFISFMIKSSVKFAAVSFLRTLLFIVKFLIFSVYHIGNFTHDFCSTFVTMSEDAPFWPLAPPGVANVRMTSSDRKSVLRILSVFHFIAVSYFFRVSECRVDARRESGCSPSRGRRCWLCLSSGGSPADLPGYPYPAYYGPLSIPRPCTVAPRRLLSRLAGL